MNPPRCLGRNTVARTLFAVLAIGLAPAPVVLAQGDVFSSGSGRNPYGGGNTSNRTGKQAQQDDSVYCQQTADGRVIPQPYGGTRRNIPCGPNFVRRPAEPTKPCTCPTPSASTAQRTKATPGANTLTKQRAAAATSNNPSATCSCDVAPVFNYFYINGINTPYSDPKGRKAWRGNYSWDWDLIRGNLLDLGPHVPAGERLPLASLPSIEAVSNEENRMGAQTYNFSGTVRSEYCEDAAKGRLTPNGLGDGGQYLIAAALCNFDDFRAGNLFPWQAGLAPGDMMESFYQSLYNRLNRAALQTEVKKFAAILLRLYEAERRQPPATRQPQFMIVIVHSQGNFFGEGLAYRLAHYEGDAGRFVYARRLAILALASPTSYETLDRDFLNLRLQHFTRQDDGILALATTPIPGAKKPFAATEPSLWPWTEDERIRSLRILAQFPEVGLPLVDKMKLGPPPGCTPANMPVCDTGLYSPFVNSHLLENYLIDPPLTRAGKPIDRTVASMLKLPDGRSPTVPVANYTLAKIRLGVKALKQSLVAGESAARRR